MLEIFPSCYPDCSCEPFQSSILQPWAFWTTLVYFVTGTIIFRRHQRENLPHLKEWTTAIGCLSLGSFFAHARFDVFSLALDEAAIVILLWSFHLNLGSWPRVLAKILSLYVALALIFFLLPLELWLWVVILNFASSMIVMGRRLGHKFLFERRVTIALALYSFSFLFYAFDRHPALCQTDWIPYGHPMWHLGSGISALMFGGWWFSKRRELSL